MDDPAKKGQPKSFVFRRGRHGAILRDLEKDMRKVGGRWVNGIGVLLLLCCSWLPCWSNWLIQLAAVHPPCMERYTAAQCLAQTPRPVVFPCEQLMAPNTASSLKESKKNQIKDFLHVAGPLGVTHFLILTATHNASYLRVAK